MQWNTWPPVGGTVFGGHRTFWTWVLHLGGWTSLKATGYLCFTDAAILATLTVNALPTRNGLHSSELSATINPFFFKLFQSRVLLQ